MVGAVVVHKGRIIGEGFHRKWGRRMPEECYRFRERRVFFERQYDLCESGAFALIMGRRLLAPRG